MPITVYKSTDVSAPQLNGTAGSLITVLDACLSSTLGYGSKTPSGWSKVYSGTNTAVYRIALEDPTSKKPTTGMYLRVDDTGTTFARITAYQTMSGINTGTGKFPNDSQIPGGIYVKKSETTNVTSRPWVLIANHKFLYLWTFPKSTTLGNLGVVGGNANSLLMFGDIVSFKANDSKHCIIHGNGLPSDDSNVSAAPYTANNHYTYVASNFTGLDESFSVKKARIAPAGIGELPYIGASVLGAYPDPVSGSVNLFPFNIVESQSAIRGRVPGFYEPYGGTSVGNDFDTIVGSSAALSSIELLLAPIYYGDQIGRAAIQITGDWDNI